MSEIKRNKNESFEAFIRRVKRLWQGSGKQLQVRKIQYFSKKKSKNLQRVSAVKRTATASKMNYLRKIGKLPPEELNARPGRKR